MLGKKRIITEAVNTLNSLQRPAIKIPTRESNLPSNRTAHAEDPQSVPMTGRPAFLMKNVTINEGLQQTHWQLPRRPLPRGQSLLNKKQRTDNKHDEHNEKFPRECLAYRVTGLLTRKIHNQYR